MGGPKIKLNPDTRSSRAQIYDGTDDSVGSYKGTKKRAKGNNLDLSSWQLSWVEHGLPQLRSRVQVWCGKQSLNFRGFFRFANLFQSRFSMSQQLLFIQSMIVRQLNTCILFTFNDRMKLYYWNEISLWLAAPSHTDQLDFWNWLANGRCD